MAEEFMDVSRLLGTNSHRVAPQTEGVSDPGGSDPLDTDQDEDTDTTPAGESNLESDEGGSAALDASGDNSQGADEELDGIDLETETDPAKLRAFAKAEQAKAGKAEEKRSDFKSEADKAKSRYEQSEQDLRLMLQAVKEGNTKNTGEAPQESRALQKLKGMDPSEAIDAGTVLEILAEQKGQQSAAAGEQKLERLLAKVDSVTAGKSDFKEVIQHYTENNLAQDPESSLMNNLGNYHRGRAHKLESENKQLRDELEQTRKKAKNARTDGKKKPAVSLAGGSFTRDTGSDNNHGPVMKLVAARMKARENASRK